MKEKKINTIHIGRAASATTSTSVGRSTARYAAPVNPLSINLYNEKSSLGVLLPSASFIAIHQQSLINETRVPVIVENDWAWVFTPKYEDNKSSEIVYIIIFYNASTAGVWLWICLSAFLSWIFFQYVRKPHIKNMKNTIISLQSWAEDANEYIRTLILELGQHDKAEARIMVARWVSSLKQERKNKPAKVQKMIDAFLNDLRKIAKSLEPKRGGNPDEDYGYRGHMAF